MMVCLCLWGFTYQAHAQWTVIDPSNLVQNIQLSLIHISEPTRLID